MENLILLKPKRNDDNRGFFAEIYQREKYFEHGIDVDFVQENHSLSWKVGTIRGLHFQVPPNSQAKLIRCGRGAIFDVAVDIRCGSPTYGHWQGYKLTAKNGYQLYIPIGFAHGFLTLEPDSEIVYKCSAYYAPDTERSILWNDPDIGIRWELKNKPILSQKDAIAPLFKNLGCPFLYGINS